MVKDDKRRKEGKEHGKKGGNPSLISTAQDDEIQGENAAPLTPTDKPPDNQDGEATDKYEVKAEDDATDKSGDILRSYKLEARKKEDSIEFEIWWGAVPRKVGKGQARKAYNRARKSATEDILLAGIKRYAGEVASTDPQFIRHPTTWLNGEGWLDEPPDLAGDPDTRNPYESGTLMHQKWAERQAAQGGNGAEKPAEPDPPPEEPAGAPDEMPEIPEFLRRKQEHDRQAAEIATEFTQLCSQHFPGITITPQIVMGQAQRALAGGASKEYIMSMVRTGLPGRESAPTGLDVFLGAGN